MPDELALEIEKNQVVLLVDDEPNLLAGLKRILKKEPYHVMTANSGKEGLEIFNSVEVDLIIADQDMPGMKGTELLEKVKALYPDTVRFMLTGKGTLQVAMDAINKGSVMRFFSKPAEEADLKSAISLALQQKELMAGSRILLQRAMVQTAFLELLKIEHPDIVEDISARVETKEVPQNMKALIKAIRVELEEKGSRIGWLPARRRW